MPASNLTELLSRLLQLINITLEGNQPTTKMLPLDQDTLDGITELRTQIHYVSDPDATTFRLRLLGCIKGKLPLVYCRHKSKTVYSTRQYCQVLPFSDKRMPPEPYRRNFFRGKCLSFKPFRCSHPTQPFFTELSTTQPTTRSSTVTTTVITTTPPSSTTPGKAVESRLVLHLLFLCFIPILNTQVSHTQSFISSLTET